jgi:hypothetical protein
MYKQILAEGFLIGFKVGYEGPRIPTNYRNLASTYIHENQLEQKLIKELKLGRIAGPFSYRPLENLRISPIGLVPKKYRGVDVEYITYHTPWVIA